MTRKWLIAIIIIAIIIVGGLGWYFLFGIPQQAQTTGPMLYVDGTPYNSTSITWNLNATPSATFYSLHNATNPGNATVNAFFNFTASFFNVSSSQWAQIYNGKKWLISNPNVTASLVLASGTLSPLLIQAFQKPNEQSTYAVYVNYTDQVLTMKFQYLGNQPAVDGQTVFTYLGFDGNANGILDASDQAFNFTNNPNRANASMLQVYTPANGSAWNSTPASPPYTWNDTTSPSNVPVSIAITTDRKNVTWTIPYGVIGATKDSYIRVVIQAFGYDFFPTGATQTTPPTPNQYYRLNCHFPAPATPFKFSVQPFKTVRFYIKIIFSANAIDGTRYTFTFNATITS
jgi:hypothetical protein